MKILIDINYKEVIKIKAGNKPGSVIRRDESLIIYLGGGLLQRSICLPSNIRRTTLKRWFTWHFTA